MPALNFKKEFAEAVEYGWKRQTIRAPRKDGRPHAKVGETIKLYTGMRTKSCRLLAEATVTRILTVKINATEMWLNGRRLQATIHSRDDPITDNEFAAADGFEGFAEMADWFSDVHGLPFEGIVIYWSDVG
jgi:hypothetical protein